MPTHNRNRISPRIITKNSELLIVRSLGRLRAVLVLAALLGLFAAPALLKGTFSGTAGGLPIVSTTASADQLAAAAGSRKSPVFRADWIDDVIEVLKDILDILEDDDDDDDDDEERGENP